MAQSCAARQSSTANSLSDIGIAAEPGVPGNPEGQADGQRGGQQEGAAVGEERQRNPGDRHDVDRHADVLEQVGEEEPQQPEDHQAGERVARPARDAEHHQEEPEEERQRADDADEAELLSHHREDEVGVLLRKEREPLLGPVEEAVPEPAARADRHLRLDRLVAGVDRIALRVHESDQAFLLVRLEGGPPPGGGSPPPPISPGDPAPLPPPPRPARAREDEAGRGPAPAPPPRRVSAARRRLTAGEASIARSRGATPAQNSIAKRIPTKTIALPRSEEHTSELQ